MRGEGETFGGEENVAAGKGDGICNLVCSLGDDLPNTIQPINKRTIKTPVRIHPTINATV